MSRTSRSRSLVACATALLLSAGAHAANILTNPTFDTNVAGWTATSAAVTLVFSNNDANGSLASGSGLMTNSEPGPGQGSGFQQCFNAPTIGTVYTYSAKILYPTGQARTGSINVGLRWMAGANCSGNQLANNPGDLSASTPSNAWVTRNAGPVAVPPGALSVRFVPYVSKVEAGGTLVGSFDDLVLNTTGLLGPTFAQAFGLASILVNGSTSLTFTITNPNASALSGLAFSDSLPAGLVVSTPNGLTNTCGGTATATAGSGSVSLSAGALGANASCTLAVSVTGTTTGSKVNNTGQITSTQSGTAGDTTATLAVVAPFTPALPIPTQDQWGMVVLAALLAAGGFRALRRRR